MAKSVHFISKGVEIIVLEALRKVTTRTNNALDFLTIERCFESYYNQLIASKVDFFFLLGH